MSGSRRLLQLPPVRVTVGLLVLVCLGGIASTLWTPTMTAAPANSPIPALSSGLKVVRLTSSVTAAEFVAAAQVETTDVLELAGGTYRPGIIRLNANRINPLLIRPAAGASVVFAGTSRSAFCIGLGGVAGNITMQDLIFDGFTMGPNGIIWTGNARNITLSRMIVRNSTGTPPYSWALYVSHDGGVSSRNIVANDWVVDGGARTIGGLGIGNESGPSVTSVRAHRWRVTNATYAIYSSVGATGVDIADWTIDSSGLTTYAYLSVVFANTQGTIRNVHATDSGGMMMKPPMVDAGGNTWR